MGQQLREGDEVVALKDIGGVLRERIPVGTRGRVTSAPWMSPVEVAFDVRDWRGHREVTVKVQPGEVAAIR